MTLLRQRCRLPKAFTLIEVVLAVGLTMGIVLAALASLAVGASAGSRSDELRVVVVLDDSASMSARVGGRTRWSRALDRLGLLQHELEVVIVQGAHGILQATAGVLHEDVEHLGGQFEVAAQHEDQVLHAEAVALDLALGADLGQQQVPLVAVALLGAELRRRLQVASLVLPTPEAAGHRRRAGVAELLHRLDRERGAHTAGAVDDDRGVLVGELVLDLGLEVAARDVDRAGDRALLVLVGFADVEVSPSPKSQRYDTSVPSGSLLPAEKNWTEPPSFTVNGDAAPNDRYLVVYRKLSGRRAF